MIGYTRIVSPSFFTAKWSGKLPDFAGGMDMDVHSEFLKNGKKITGCTAIHVNEIDPNK